jgi:hypothetical protein
MLRKQASPKPKESGMFKVARLSALLALILVHGSVFAWGAVGHMTVGTVADQLIAGTPAAKKVRKILGSNLRTAAVWADCTKGVSDVAFKYSADGRYAECAIYENDASKALMVAYVKRNATNCERPRGAEICHKQYHYTDVAVQETLYRMGLVGTTDHDVVSAFSAAIAVLQGQPAPAPFHINSKKEALRLLVHFVGDIHQPLHVAAVYLDAQGQLVDPDQGTFDPATQTRGGNNILKGTQKLHALWDTVPVALHSDRLLPAALEEARAIPVSQGPMSDWSQAWASETLDQGRVAFRGLSYSAEDANQHYAVTLPPGYSELRANIQRAQILKAGARLAQILTATWP